MVLGVEPRALCRHAFYRLSCTLTLGSFLIVTSIYLLYWRLKVEGSVSLLCLWASPQTNVSKNHRWELYPLRLPRTLTLHSNAHTCTQQAAVSLAAWPPFLCSGLVTPLWKEGNSLSGILFFCAAVSLSSLWWSELSKGSSRGGCGVCKCAFLLVTCPPMGGMTLRSKVQSFTLRLCS